MAVVIAFLESRLTLGVANYHPLIMAVLNTMNQLETEQDILHGAMEAFPAETALWLDVVEFDARKGDRQIDAILQMPGNGTHFRPKLRNGQTHTNLGAVINQLQRLAPPDAGLPVADYINPNMARKPREAGIQYIDVVGNACLNQPPVYGYRKDNKPEARTGTRTKIGKAFQLRLSLSPWKQIFALRIQRQQGAGGDSDRTLGAGADAAATQILDQPGLAALINHPESAGLRQQHRSRDNTRFWHLLQSRIQFTQFCTCPGGSQG